MFIKRVYANSEIFYSYIYGAVVEVTVDTAPDIVYAAMKYMLPALVRHCGVCLSEGLNVNNVIQVLETSFIIDDTELESNCRRLIAQKAKNIFTGTAILSASPQAVGVILQMDKIPLKEVVIYNTCIAWAKHQFELNNPLEDRPTDLQIREMLGGLLYKIRFPIMEVSEFVEISKNKSILTPEEKMQIFYYLTTKTEDSQLVFPTESRGFGEEVWIERAVTCLTGRWSSVTTGDVIDFTTNQDILLTGIGLYTGYHGAGYEADVAILQPNKCLFKKKLTVPYTEDANQFKVSVNEPIFIKAGVRYTVGVLSHADIGHYGKLCKAVCTESNVIFRFSHHHQSRYTHQFYGQIPRLYFRF